MTVLILGRDNNGELAATPETIEVELIVFDIVLDVLIQRFAELVDNVLAARSVLRKGGVGLLLLTVVSRVVVVGRDMGAELVDELVVELATKVIAELAAEPIVERDIALAAELAAKLAVEIDAELDDNVYPVIEDDLAIDGTAVEDATVAEKTVGRFLDEPNAETAGTVALVADLLVTAKLARFDEDI